MDSLLTDPNIAVRIFSTAEGRNLTAGTNLSLFCTVDGAANLIPEFSFEWTHVNVTGFTRTGTNSRRLHFPSLKLSEAGEYMCQVSISSHLLNSKLIIMSMYPSLIRVFGKLWYTCHSNNKLLCLYIIVPIPIVTIVLPSQAVFVGSSPNVTCVAEFNDTVDVPLNINITFGMREQNLIIDSDYSVHMRSYTRYTRNFTVNNIQENHEYACVIYPPYSELSSIYILLHEVGPLYAYGNIQISKLL